MLVDIFQYLLQLCSVKFNLEATYITLKHEISIKKISVLKVNFDYPFVFEAEGSK